ncbi:hypothetical protein GALAXY_25 [Arthrobacter phage Galaxy]|uniref:Uncharacterized protein n=1 Tax=Arthrobacter phage Galaxy TaxID=1772326 RepID=A0A0U4IU67_9CAUD|nr:holin [Arthrobacter phage Galaxy]ALY08871.1 hypothetical protein GALAXY_25 [Arthrobacter phage Galaxy]
MGEHVAGAAPAVPSQVKYPWRAFWRTVWQVGVPAFGLVLLAGPAVLGILAEELGTVLPDHVTAWLLGAAAVLTALSGAVARIMAIPGVNAWLSRFKLDAGASSPSAE